MIPKTAIPEETYKSAFKQYVYGLSEKWLGGGIDLSQTDSVLAKIGEVSKENHRAN
jgi:hypothetical protein